MGRWIDSHVYDGDRCGTNLRGKRREERHHELLRHGRRATSAVKATGPRSPSAAPMVATSRGYYLEVGRQLPARRRRRRPLPRVQDTRRLHQLLQSVDDDADEQCEDADDKTATRSLRTSTRVAGWSTFFAEPRALPDSRVGRAPLAVPDPQAAAPVTAVERHANPK